MSVTQIEPLPSDLGSFGPHDYRAAINSRKELLAEVFEQAGESYDLDRVTCLKGSSATTKVTELRRLNDELARLEEFATVVNLHPGHPRQKGARSSSHRDGSRFGRMEGLGADWLKGMKASSLDGTSGGATLPGAFFDPRIRDLPQRTLFVRSLIPTTNVGATDKVDYIRQTAFTNNAAAVAAHALKPTSVLTVERVTAPIQVIAHLSEALDRSILSDHDQLTSFIDNQLRLGVLLEEERQILLGNGTAPNISGILDQAGLQTQAKGADPTPDAVHKAITKIRAVFAEPDAVVFHPNDWESIALLRTADGEYIWSHPAKDGPLTIWGLKVVVSPVMTENTALVGAFGVGAEVYQREGTRISFAETGLGDTAGQELFSRNEIRWRAESRLGLAVIRPDCFCTVSGI